MGTRADFYVGVGKKAEWLGSIALDGYPNGRPIEFNIPNCVTEAAFCAQVGKLLDVDDYATKPAQGWPWPWEDSHTTDFAYCFEGNKVQTFCFGKAHSEAAPDDEGPAGTFPDMTKRQKVTMGKRSGMIVLGQK